MMQRGGQNYYISSTGQVLDIRPYDCPRRLDSPDPAIRFRDLVLYTNWCLEIYGLVRRNCLRRTSLHGTYHGTDKRVLAELALMGRFALLDEVMLFYRQHPVQAERYRGSAVARDLYLSGDGGRRWSKVPRWHNLSGYCRAVHSAELGIGSQLACFAGIGRWFLQPAKWAPILREAREIYASTLTAESPSAERGRMEFPR
jgi:hypothetical protein